MEDTALSGIRALKSSNLKKLGGNMNTAQECFRELGLSTPGIEDNRNCNEQRSSWGEDNWCWRRGCVIILTKEPGELTSIYKRMGCESFQTLLGVEGVK